MNWIATSTSHSLSSFRSLSRSLHSWLRRSIVCVMQRVDQYWSAFEICELELEVGANDRMCSTRDRNIINHDKATLNRKEMSRIQRGIEQERDY